MSAGQTAVAQSAFSKFWNHPAGMYSSYAPAYSPSGMKAGIVLAGINDLRRPVEKLSVQQQIALAATGVIWSRYALVITPVNYNLMSVNIFVGSTGLYQLYRIWE
ncbi:hypothetical protein HDU82_005517 [Entophlyctis luteolus]|nr:hypothetical protein HDU82_005517 [Entophlyctis luteolus]